MEDDEIKIWKYSVERMIFVGVDMLKNRDGVENFR